MSELRAPTMAELTVMLRDLPDGPRRTRLEGWYWALAIEQYGADRAHAYEREYRWLRAEAFSQESAA
jgi:hypothetical protein